MTDDDFFAPPAFKPQEALVGLRRQLRDLRPLVERAGAEPVRFELAGSSVMELSLAADAIEVKLAKRPARTPEWEARSLRSSADVRALVDEVRKRLGRWNEDRE